MTDLRERKVDTIEKKEVKIVNQEFSQINKKVSDVLSEIKERQNQLKNKKELTDEDFFLLRTQIVFLESVFDYYIHEIITYGIIQTYKGDWPINNKFNNILVKLSTCIEMIKKPELDAEILKEYIIDYYGGMTFLDKENLNAKLRVIEINPEQVASQVFDDDNPPQAQQKFAEFIKELYNRRNRIVHQCDMEFGSNEKCTINVEEVDNYIAIVEKTIEVITQLIIYKESK